MMKAIPIAPLIISIIRCLYNYCLIFVDASRNLGKALQNQNYLCFFAKTWGLFSKNTGLETLIYHLSDIPVFWSTKSPIISPKSTRTGGRDILEISPNGCHGQVERLYLNLENLHSTWPCSLHNSACLYLNTKGGTVMRSDLFALAVKPKSCLRTFGRDFHFLYLNVPFVNPTR